LRVSAERFTHDRLLQVTSFLTAEPVSEWEGPVAGQVTLPEGFVETANGQTRGHGWAYIQATSGVTQDQIGAILENGEHVSGDGLRDYVIGQAGERTIILTIIGGTLMAADSFERPVEHDSSESNCNGDDFTVKTENERNTGPDNPEHTIGDEKPINSLDKLDRILKNPDRIVDFGPRRYLFKVYDNGKTAVVKLHKNMKYDDVYELITQLTGNDGGLYDSLEEATDKIEEEEEDGKDPSKEIDC